MSVEIAVLFADPRGCYAGLPGVDLWDVHRDARTYAGPWPVVAHPPCQLWGCLANINFTRWGGEHNRPGNDGCCFASALANVRRCGRVLEHPAHTRAFVAHGLPKPVGVGWQQSSEKEWVCTVWQSAYGHLANKATWLFYVGGVPPFSLDWSRPVGTHKIGGRRSAGKSKPSIRGPAASATPPAFRDALLALARAATK